MGKHAVFCGRFSPFHLGHEAVLNRMLEKFGEENSCIVIGSSNAPISERDFFTAEERRDLITRVFPNVRTTFAPDYESDDQWLSEVDAGILALGIDPYAATYFAGSERDVPFFVRAGRDLHIVNRYDGTTPKVSGTDVRRALREQKPIEHLVHPILHEPVLHLYRARFHS